jgi:hypothetical protein
LLDRTHSTPSLRSVAQGRLKEGGRPSTIRVEISGDDFADDLVTGDHSRHSRRQFAFHDVKISATHTTCQHL